MYYIHVCRHVRMYECTYARMLHACLCGKLLDGWEFCCHCCEDHRGAFAYALYIRVSSYINLLEVPMSKFKNLWIGSTAGCLGSEVHRILIKIIKSAESSCQSSVVITSQGFHWCHYAVEHLMLLTRWAKCRAHVSAGSTAHGRRRRSSTRGCQQRREPCHRKKAPTLNKAALSAQNQRAPLSLCLSLSLSSSNGISPLNALPVRMKCPIQVQSAQCSVWSLTGAPIEQFQRSCWTSWTSWTSLGTRPAVAALLLILYFFKARRIKQRRWSKGVGPAHLQPRDAALAWTNKSWKFIESLIGHLYEYHWIPMLDHFTIWIPTVYACVVWVWRGSDRNCLKLIRTSWLHGIPTKVAWEHDTICKQNNSDIFRHVQTLVPKGLPNL